MVSIIICVKGENKYYRKYNNIYFLDTIKHETSDTKI